jgi:hypothetical protein
VEEELLKRSIKFEKNFESLHRKAEEMAGYMRINLDRFPSLNRFNHETEMEMLLFKVFLDELLELRLSNKVLGTLMPLMADHMSREECYYLTKLSEVSEVKKPDCDPGKPRVEE